MDVLGGSFSEDRCFGWVVVVGLFGGVQCVVVLGFWLGCLLAGPVLVYLSFLESCIGCFWVWKRFLVAFPRWVFSWVWVVCRGSARCCVGFLVDFSFAWAGSSSLFS